MTEVISSNELKEKLNSLIQETMIENFFSDNKASQKKKEILEKTPLKPYNMARIKARNYLTNISYKGVTKEDLFNGNFVFDVSVLLANNLNPFSAKRKVQEKRNQDMIYMLWDECVPMKFYRYICGSENFTYLNGKNVFHP